MRDSANKPDCPRVGVGGEDRFLPSGLVGQERALHRGHRGCHRQRRTQDRLRASALGLILSHLYFCFVAVACVCLRSTIMSDNRSNSITNNAMVQCLFFDFVNKYFLRESASPFM